MIVLKHPDVFKQFVVTPKTFELGRGFYQRSRRGTKLVHYIEVVQKIYYWPIVGKETFTKILFYNFLKSLPYTSNLQLYDSLYNNVLIRT